MGLRSKFLVPTLGLIVVGMGVSAFVSFRNTHGALQHALTEQVEQVTEQTTGLVRSWTRDRQRDLHTWSGQKVFQSATQSSFLGKAARQGASELLAALKSDYPYYEDICLADAEGALVAASTEKLIGAISVADREYFRQAMAGTPNVTDGMRSKATKNPVFVVATPVMDGEKTAGVLFGVVDINSFANEFLGGVKVGDTGYAYVFNAAGLVLAHPDKKQILELDMNTLDFGKQMVSQKEGAITYTFADVEKFVVFRAVGTPAWTVAVGVPTGELLAPAKHIGYVNLAIAGVVVAAATLLMFFITQTVLRPINRVADQLRDIAEGEGDLTVSLEVKGTDEIAQLAKGFNTFVEKIRVLIAEVKGSSLEMASTAEELSTTTTQIAASNEEMSSQSMAVASAAEEMSATVDDVARNAGAVREASEQAGQAASDGGEVVVQALAAMEEIATVVREAGATVQTLGSRLKDVTMVIEVIEDIADQTNLLALNAAIEAARAGEHGRGFAVVADEVRKLAEKTVKATQEITGTIGAIQKESQRAVDSVTRGEASVGKGTELGSKAGEAIRAIEEKVIQASEQTQQIATATEQLAVTIREMASNTDQIAKGMQQNMAGVSEIANTADVVARKAEELRSGTDRFRT